jgi:hypothetical protein
VTKDDARIFLDSLSTTPSDDLTTRKAGFIAFDAADLDPETGSGLGNLFDTELATGKEYQHGDSRGDITGLFDGIPDEMVDESDIDYVFSHLNGSDARLDFNGDSLINSADIAELVQNILGTTFGDSDLDGDVDLSDLSNLAANYGQSPRTWTQGNFDGDNDVDLSDLSTLATYYGNGSAEAFAAFQSLVPEPACIALLPLAGMVLTRRRR